MTRPLQAITAQEQAPAARRHSLATEERAPAARRHSLVARDPALVAREHALATLEHAIAALEDALAAQAAALCSRDPVDLERCNGALAEALSNLRSLWRPTGGTPSPTAGLPGVRELERIRGRLSSQRTLVARAAISNRAALGSMGLAPASVEPAPWPGAAERRPTHLLA
ncbi:MAG: hypothetical protein ABWZ78_09760 [Burkholderiaceae bacterium]